LPTSGSDASGKNNLEQISIAKPRRGRHFSVLWLKSRFEAISHLAFNATSRRSWQG
jgi:hypothetical protein